mgnify:CR=1 FL=1
MKTAAHEIEHIKEMLPKLSKTALHELCTFANFLTEKEKKHKAFEQRLSKIEAESDTVTFDSVEDAMNAIRNWDE